MFQTNLPICYGWFGRFYGPGPASIPEDLARAAGIRPTEAEVIPAEVPDPVLPPSPPQALTKQKNLESLKQLRSQELQALYESPDGGYQPIKDLAVNYGLHTKAPSGGWDRAIPDIVHYEAEHSLLDSK